MTSLARTLRNTRALALLVALAVAGCSGGSGNSGSAASAASADTACKTGKEAAFAAPAGTPFTLPAGVMQEGEITGDVDVNCGNESYVEYGSDLILLCVGLRNTTNADITVTVPAGTTFVSKNPATQNGITLQSHQLKVPAGAVAYFYFRPFCLNKLCAASGTQDRFTFGNVTSDAQLREVIMLASTKKIDGDVGSALLGQLVWDVTDGDGITAEHRAQLASTPNL